jgi:type I restriction enzyme S subunit
MAEYLTIGDLLDDGVVEATTGFPFGEHNSEGKGVAHIRPFNVSADGDIRLDVVKSIPEEAATGKPTLKRGDVVFNNTNSKELVGKCALWGETKEPVFSNHMTRVRVTADICDPAYLAFAILHHWTTGKSEMLARSHVAQASIIGGRFREIEIPWKATAEQRAIGQVLAAVRASSRLQSQQRAQAEVLKREVGDVVFLRGLRIAAMKETEIGRIPTAWQVVPLGSLGRVGNGSTPKRSTPEFWHDGSFPWLNSSKMYDREITAAEQWVTERALNACHLPRVKPGAVLMAITGQGKTLGHCAVLHIEAAVSQHVAYIQVDSTRALPSFVRGYLETQYAALRQVAAGGGSTKGALTCAYLRSLPVPLPSLAEQEETVAVIDQLDKKIDLHRRREESLDQLFKSLLGGLMTGEMCVADMNEIETATRQVTA